MATPSIINRFGKMTGWSAVTANIAGRDMEGITMVEYNDNVEMAAAYGAGNMPVGTEEKNYAAAAKVRLNHEELVALQKQLPKGSRIAGLFVGDIIVAYEHNGSLSKDALRNCYLKNNGRSVTQGDGSIATEIEIQLTHIDWNI